MAVLVEAGDVRPARQDGTCFYCRQPLGAPHVDDCVIVCKYVRVRVTFDLVTEVPAYRSKEEPEFHWNDGTYCTDNVISALADWCDEDRPTGWTVSELPNGGQVIELADLDAYVSSCTCAVSTIEQIEEVPGPPHHGVNESVWMPGPAYVLRREIRGDQ